MKSATMKRELSFATSKAEAMLISKIADRAIKDGLVTDRLSIEMDITACHANGCPLDLMKLLKASVADFGHDVLGIRRFIDRETGELQGHFDPRCSDAA